MEDELVMRFDPTTIEHLGVQMYSTLPPVIAELVSNSYDADATAVKVILNDNDDKIIKVIDNGHGMTFRDINTKFLKIGRNRRKDAGAHLTIQKTESGKRDAIGKKGIGKLSFFGIASLVEVETIRDGKLNKFLLDWEDLLESGQDYKPTIIIHDQETEKASGTSITLKKITRKSGFSLENISYNLAKTFSIFDEADFEVEIIHNDSERIIVENKLRYESIDAEFEWSLPLPDSVNIGYEYEYSNQIKGQIISAKSTVPSAMKGITLFSRGKLVNEPEFYDEKATSFGYAYFTGWIDVSFIDDWPKDVISTNRKSLNWEDEDASKLRAYLNFLVRFIYKDQRKKKKESQIELIKEIASIDIEEWQTSLPKHEGILARKMTNAVLDSEGLTTEKQAELVKFIKDSFQFEAFKEFSNELSTLDFISSDKIIGLFREWELIEAREMYKLATGRIQAIRTLEKLIDENAKEVQEMHPFFEKFPWILDPRINMFRHEVAYVKLLKENFKEPDLEEINRRIDFLCTSVSEHKFIIELKRPQHVIDFKDIDQAKDYRSFIQDYCSSDPKTSHKVIAYVVGGSIKSKDRKTRDEIQSMRDTDKVYVKTYTHLLQEARNYHQEFIDKYEEIESSKAIK